MGPWSTAAGRAATARALGDVTFDAKTAAFYREQIELPFFEFHLKGRRRPKLSRGVGVRDRHQPVAALRRLAAAGGHDREPSTSPRDGRLRGRAASRAATAFDEYVSDPAKPVPYIDNIAIGMTPRVHDRRPALRRHAARRAASTRPSRWRTTSRIAGPIEVELHVSTTGTDSDWVVKLIDVYPDDYPDPPEPSSGHRPSANDGRLPATGARRAFRGKFRNSFEKPEPFEPGQADADPVHAARRLPHVPPRPPDHGAGAEHAGSRWWTATRRRSWTSPRRSQPTSRRRRSGSTGRGRPPPR